MKKYFLIIAIVFFGLNISCKENKTSEAITKTSQMKEVMAIHDEVMPEMGKIGKLVADLRKRVDSDQGTAEEKKAMEDLQEAHKTMMEWMQGFGKNFDSEEILNGKALSPEKQIQLDKEEEKVKIVKERINSSIANAKALLAQ